MAAVKLRLFAAYCQSRGWVRINPFPSRANGGVKITGTQARRDYLRLSASELLAMLEGEPNPRDRCILAFGMNTGLRVSEIMSIRLGDIDLDNSEFFVSISKSHTTDRMPITDDLRAELDVYLKWYRESQGELRSEWYLFPRLRRTYFTGERDGDDNRLRTETRLWPVMKASSNVGYFAAKRGLAQLGYAERELEAEGFHTLRRSVARLYFDSLSEETGYHNALREVAALLHHKSTRTTEVYLGLDIDRARRDARLRDQPFLTRLAASSKPNLREVAE